MRELLRRRWRLGLAGKTLLPLSLGVLAIFALIGYITDRALSDTNEAALENGLSRSQSLAASIDGLTAHIIRQMDALARDPALEDESRQRSRRLEVAFEMMDSLRALTLLDAQGGVLWQATSPGSPPPASLDYPRLAAQVAASGEVVVSKSPPQGLANTTVSVISVPVPGRDEQPMGVLVGEIGAGIPGLLVVALPETTTTSNFYLVASDGEVMASSPNGIGRVSSDHMALLGPLIEEGRSGSRLHQPPGGSSHVVAYSPLTMAPGGVIFEERNDLILAIGQRLRLSFLVIGAMALAMATAGAWFYARHLVNPVLAIREGTARIAGGNLEQPLTLVRSDEMGDLARDFEAMRQELLAARNEHVRFDAALERRVESQAAHVKQLLGKVISAQEAERGRIARELHDGATQMVTALLLQVETMSSSLPSGSPAAIETAPRAKKYAIQALDEVRRVIQDLRPPALDDLGLVGGLRDYAQNRLGDAGILMGFSVEGPVKQMDATWETAVYRIAQEAINNVANHSVADHASITLEFGPDSLRVTVKDDGKGFVLEDVLKNTSGIGLAGMLERAEILGGHLAVVSNLGAGTEIKLEVPLDETQ